MRQESIVLPPICSAKRAALASTRTKSEQHHPQYVKRAPWACLRLRVLLLAPSPHAPLAQRADTATRRARRRSGFARRVPLVSTAHTPEHQLSLTVFHAPLGSLHLLVCHCAAAVLPGCTLPKLVTRHVTHVWQGRHLPRMVLLAAALVPRGIWALTVDRVLACNVMQALSAQAQMAPCASSAVRASIRRKLGPQVTPHVKSVLRGDMVI